MINLEMSFSHDSPEMKQLIEQQEKYNAAIDYFNSLPFWKFGEKIRTRRAIKEMRKKWNIIY